MEVFFGKRRIVLIKDADKSVAFCSKRLKLFLSDESEMLIRFNIGYKNDFIELFKNEYFYVEAAGGLVYNKDSNLLVITRFGIPDLPKGKIETGEDKKAAALREVKEECGITAEIIEEISPSFHIYPYRESYALKKTYWFKMKHHGNERTVPQQEEDITDAYWADKKTRLRLSEQTYGNLSPYFLL